MGTTHFLDALQPHRAGVYVNFLDSDDDTSRVHEAYGDANHRRLAEIKAKYDPGSVFHINKNIKPEGRISEPPCDRHGLNRCAIESGAFVLTSSAGCHCQTAQATHC